MGKVRAVPEGLHTVTPALVVKGAAEALEFYKKAFGAEERSRAPDPTGTKIWHAEFRIGDSTLFINDESPEMGSPAYTAQLWIYIDDVDAAYKRAVDAGAKPAMPLMDMFWGDRFGKVVDRWGNGWSLAQHIKDLSPAEMKKAEQEFIAQMKTPKKS